MKYTFINIYLTLIFIFQFVEIKAQNPTAILEKHIETIGGYSKLDNAKAIYIKGVKYINGSFEMKFEKYVKTPDKVWIDLICFDNRHLIEGANANERWLKHPFGDNYMQLSGHPGRVLDDEKEFNGSIYAALKNGDKIEFKGEIERDGKKYYLYKINSKTRQKQVYIDATTFLISKTEETHNIDGVILTYHIAFTGYDKTEGIQFPRTITNTVAGKEYYTIKIDKIEVNPTFSESIFNAPNKIEKMADGSDLQKKSEQEKEKGLYLAKKKYLPIALPEFQEVKNQIPVPVISSKKEYVNLYWKVWEMAFKHLRQPQAKSGFVSNYWDEAFHNNIYQWDSNFMILFGKYINGIFDAAATNDNFYVKQHENGFIAREISEEDGSDFYFFLEYYGTKNMSNPPLFAWSEWEIYKYSGNKKRLALVLPALEKLAEWMDTYHLSPNSKHQLYWQSGMASGMDNTPRRGSGWICISTQMVMFYNDLAKICKETGQTEKQKLYEEKAKAIALKVNKWMWDEKDGIYYDVNDKGEPEKVKTVASFWPMLAGISDSIQNKRLAINLKDTATFWRKFPFPSLAANEPAFEPKGDYWRGSNWAPTNYMIIKGLEKVGNDKFAREASEKYLNGIYETFLKTNTVWENYSSESFDRGSNSKPDFVGWTGLGPIVLLIENIIGITVDAPSNTVVWKVSRVDGHGIRNLRINNKPFDLVAASRKTSGSPLLIQVKSSTDFKLIIVKENQSKEFNIYRGNCKIQL